jgi:DNA-binding transcriptional regulator YiaG
LHRAIGAFLVTEKKVLSGKELRFIRKEMDLTQAEL